jgi:hypothetical protein
MRPERALRYPSVAVAFTALLIATPAHASYPISMSEYHPSLCQLVPNTAAYTSQLTLAGVVLSPPDPPVVGQVAKFVCPVTLTSSIANFWLTNLSFTMDSAPFSAGASLPDCSLILDTISGGLNVVPIASITNVTGASAGPNLSNYSGVSRAYVNCTLASGSVKLNRYSASVSYF